MLSNLSTFFSSSQWWFITGGAICASWWYGPLADTQEGYVLVHVDQGNNFRWEYIDYGWNEIKE